MSILIANICFACVKFGLTSNFRVISILLTIDIKIKLSMLFAFELSWILIITYNITFCLNIDPFMLFLVLKICDFFMNYFFLVFEDIIEFILFYLKKFVDYD